MQGEVGTPMIKHEKTLHVDICSCHRCSGSLFSPSIKKIQFLSIVLIFPNGDGKTTN
jgi:hypothetical protein